MSGQITFKEWLPDLPALNNPGMTEAKNVLRYGGQYISYSPLATTGNSMSAYGKADDALFIANEGDTYVGLTGTASALVLMDVFGAITALSATMSAVGEWSLARYEDYVIATHDADTPLAHTIGSSGSAVVLGSAPGTAPPAHCVGVVGQFVMLGGILTGGISAVRWSGIDDPFSWPTPGSATAIAQQSGEQVIDASMGTVQQITTGDQYGLIFLDGGIVRATYVGGAAVFQFDTIYRGKTVFGPKSCVAFGGNVFFAGPSGFSVTDGVSVRQIGVGKVDRYFWDRVDPNYRTVRAGFDFKRRIAYWAFARAGDSGVPSEIITMNVDTLEFCRSEDSLRTFVRGKEGVFENRETAAIGTDGKLGYFSGTPGTAILTTGEQQINPGGYGRISAVKPFVDVTANAVTVAIGSRGDQQSSVSYTAEVTANSRSGFSDFRSEARYHRARLTITGTFNSAHGAEVIAVPSGQT